MRSQYQTVLGAVWLALTVTTPAVTFADEGKCAALVATTLDDVTIERATLQPAGEPAEGANVPNPSDAATLVPASGLPSFCRVVGSARPEVGSDVRFEVWLPSDTWTGRFTSGNNGGFAGSISYGDLVAAVAAGHAGASTDTGHVSAVPLDSAWAKGHPELVRDYGWRAIHVTTVVAKKLIAAYYGREPDHSYFIGCSNGGRQGLMEAWRFPDDYDGILAGAPVTNFTALAAAFISTVQAQLPEGAALRPAQMPLLQSEVLKQCDELDGQADGLVAAPLSCELDIAPLACGANDNPECFAPAQLAALTQIIDGRRDCHQRTVAAGFLPSGAEAGPLGWGGWLAADQDGKTPHAILARGLLQDLMQEPTATLETFDFASDQRALEDALGPELDVQPRLRRYFERGGKLILWQGWADAAISTDLTLAFHREVVRNAGSHADDALRLFMVPGVQHCGAGTGPGLLGQEGAPLPEAEPERNFGAALEAWVETGRVPERVIGGFSSDPAAGRERLVCAYPKRAALQSGQDPNKGESYECLE